MDVCPGIQKVTREPSESLEANTLLLVGGLVEARGPGGSGP